MDRLHITLLFGTLLVPSTTQAMAAFTSHKARLSTLFVISAQRRYSNLGQSRALPLALVNVRFLSSSATTTHASTAAAAATAADAEPVLNEEMEDTIARLRDVLDSAQGKAVFLTGAGVSTDSGIPDYRGPQGSYSRGHKPMTHDQFTSSEANRKRYWARSTFGWSSFITARPNDAHFALAALEAAGKVAGIITQNVDGLHQKAGSQHVVDLHGRNDQVECLSCGMTGSRDAHQRHLARLNADWIARNTPNAAADEITAEDQASVSSPKAEGVHASRVGVIPSGTNAGAFKAGDSRLRADGDAEFGSGADLSQFQVPGCIRCGGVLKPNVVFFGDNVPRSRVEKTYRMVDDSTVLVAAGSSLQVYSAYRLVDRVAKAGKTIAVVNLGQTRPEKTGLQVEAGVGTVLPLLL